MQISIMSNILRLLIRLWHYAIEDSQTDYRQAKNHRGGEIGQLIQNFVKRIRALLQRSLLAAYRSKTLKRILVISILTIVGLYIKRKSPSSPLEIIFDNLESIALGSAGVIFLMESEERKKRDHYEAWQVINLAQNQPSSGGRIQALQDLNKDNENLEGIDLHEADLSGINLSFGKLSKANIKGARLDNANLSKAILTNANLEGTDLKYANLEGTDLKYANLKGASLEYANLKGASLEYANLKGAILSSANLEDTILEFVNLDGALLINANFEHANLGYASLKGSTLQNTNLKDAEMGRVELEDAHLIDANLKSASLHKACLRGAKLWDANLACALLSFANLEEADFSGADLKNISWNSKTRWKGAKGLDTSRNLSSTLQSHLFSLGLLSSLPLLQKQQPPEQHN